MTKLISTHEVAVSYDTVAAIQDASFTLSGGEILGLAGPNGAGKSSLVKAILGLVPLAQGQVVIDGISSSGGRVARRGFRRAVANIAYVPQKQAVVRDFPISVEAVVAMGQYGQLGWLGRPSKTQRDAIDLAIETLGLADLRKRQFAALSGGQQQKTLVARALAQNAPCIILDEPFRGVDAKSQTSIANALVTHRANGGGVLLVHHGADLLAQICDRVALVNQTIVAQGTPDHLVSDPKLAALFGGSIGAAKSDGYAPYPLLVQSAAFSRAHASLPMPLPLPGQEQWGAHVGTQGGTRPEGYTSPSRATSTRDLSPSSSSSPLASSSTRSLSPSSSSSSSSFAAPLPLAS